MTTTPARNARVAVDMMVYGITTIYSDSRAHAILCPHHEVRP